METALERYGDEGKLGTQLKAVGGFQVRSFQLHRSIVDRLKKV